jgi:hypothetical protein
MRKREIKVAMPPSLTGAKETSLPWSSALLAALPHLLAPLVFVGGWLLRTLSLRGSLPDRDFIEIIFAVLVALVLIISWRRRWPRWSGSWVGYASVMLFILILNGLSFLFRNYPELAGNAAIIENIPILAWLLLSMMAIIYLANDDPFAGLLAILPIAPVLLAVVGLDEVRGDEPLFLAIALMTAVAAVFVARARSLASGIGFVFAGNLLAAFLISYLATYHSTTSPIEPSPAAMMRQSLILLIYALFWLIPFLLLFAWRRVRRARANA